MSEQLDADVAAIIATHTEVQVCDFEYESGLHCLMTEQGWHQLPQKHDFSPSGFERCNHCTDDGYGADVEWPCAPLRVALAYQSLRARA